MPEQARVTSLEALERFRANLIVFIDEAHRSVDEVQDEVRRTRMWVQMEQRSFWEREIRKRQQKLDAAEQELMSAKLSSLRDNVRAQEEAVRKARAAVKQAEEKHRNVRRWTRDFDHFMEPLTRKVEGFRQILDSDLPKALSFLLQAQRTLEAYADIEAPRHAKPKSTSGAAEAAPAEGASELPE
jgi:hypothetical protein